MIKLKQFPRWTLHRQPNETANQAISTTNFAKLHWHQNCQQITQINFSFSYQISGNSPLWFQCLNANLINCVRAENEVKKLGFEARWDLFTIVSYFNDHNRTRLTRSLFRISRTVSWINKKSCQMKNLIGCNRSW